MTVHATKVLGGVLSAVSKNRIMGSASQLANADTVNNTWCPALNLTALAGKSGHLQRWHFGYGLATLIAQENVFDSAPRIAIAPAAVQNGRGTRTNPYAHVLPCGLQANGQAWHTLFKSQKAIAEACRSFGLGVMANEEFWEEDVDPSVLNVGDRVVEKHHSQIGLCETFRRTFEDTTGLLSWKGSGFQLPSEDAAAALLKHVDIELWLPRMKIAYEEEILRQTERLRPLDSKSQTYARLQARILVLTRKLETARDAKVNYAYVIQRVFKAMSEERAARAAMHLKA
ncbi:hypothetical protein ACQ86G_28100 [Roseateles chitinivorans]|uniref:hypothetical protein n=1 Tax=Roseateles chitinivorans TaxID=2917965 RepID=UPI003D67B2AF